jgi:hypothetical protein
MLSFEEFQAVNNRSKLQESVASDKNVKKPKSTKNNSTKNKTEISKPASLSWRQQLGSFLEMFSIQTTIVCLIFVDIFIAFADNSLAAHNEKMFGTLFKSQAIFSVLIRLLFSIELLLVYLSFGFQALSHFGYLIDFLIILSQLYLDQIGYGSDSKLLNFCRLWRLLRLIVAAVNAEKEKQKVIEQQLEGFQNTIRKLEIDKQTITSELAKEKEARTAIEKLLQNYKEEVDTLNEALKIAAMDIAEVAQDDDSSHNVSDEDEREMMSARSGGNRSRTGGSSASSAGYYKSEELRAILEDEDDIASSIADTVKSSIIVHEDGKFEYR